MDVLVRATSLGEWDRGVQAAAQLAATLHGRLTALCSVPAGLPLPPGRGDASPAAYLAERERELRRAQDREPEFIAWAGSIGVEHPAWLAHTAITSDALAYASNWHDLLVLPLDDSGEDSWSSAGGVARIVLEAPALCLALPAGTSMPARCQVIAIAFNGSVEAIRALHAALPLLRNATQVLVLLGEGKPIFDPPPPFPLNDWCVQHLRHVDYVPLAATAGADALLREAHAGHADALVMGAYGHTRFAEWALGGVTRHMLQHADLPLLMRH